MSDAWNSQKGGKKPHAYFVRKAELLPESIVLACRVFAVDWACGGYAMPAECTRVLGPVPCRDGEGTPWHWPTPGTLPAAHKK